MWSVWGAAGGVEGGGFLALNIWLKMSQYAIPLPLQTSEEFEKQVHRDVCKEFHILLVCFLTLFEYVLRLPHFGMAVANRTYISALGPSHTALKVSRRRT